MEHHFPTSHHDWERESKLHSKQEEQNEYLSIRYVDLSQPLHPALFAIFFPVMLTPFTTHKKTLARSWRPSLC